MGSDELLEHTLLELVYDYASYDQPVTDTISTQVANIIWLAVSIVLPRTHSTRGPRPHVIMAFMEYDNALEK